MKEYRLSSMGDTPQIMTRIDTYRYDYRGAAYFRPELMPSLVTSFFPAFRMFLTFTRDVPGDYFLDTLFSSKVPYNQLLDEPRFADKFGGLPVIRNLAELKEVVDRSGRAWIVFAPYRLF